MADQKRHAIAALGIVGVVLLLCTACQSWTQYMGNPALNGNDSGEAILAAGNVSRLHQVETFPAGGATADVMSPVVSGSTLYAGSLDGHLIAASVDGQTGCTGTPKVCQPLWTASVPGMDQASNPLVAGNVVYETFSNSGGSSGELAAFDAAGTTNCSGTPKVCQPLWTANVISPFGVNLDGTTVFVNDLQGRSLDAFDATGTTGCSGSPKVCQPLWTAPFASLSVPSVADGRVYVVDNPLAGGGQVAAFDEAGTTNCSGTPRVCQPLFTVALETGSPGSVDVSGGVGYVETETLDLSPTITVPSRLVAFDATGVQGCTGDVTVPCNPLWTAPLGGAAWFNTPAVAGGRVYAPLSNASGQTVVDVFDAAGSTGCSGSPVVCQPLMTTTPVSGLAEFGSPTVTNGLVFEHGAAYDATGVQGCSGSAPVVCSPLWTTSTPTPYSSPAISLGTLFVGSNDGSVHAYQLGS